jgi:hypothetical protein
MKRSDREPSPRAAPPDVLELRQNRDGARRRIPWELLEPDGLDARARAKVGASWLGRMKQEHLAVGAFALLAHELAADGCDPLVLALITRAATDEVRHAEICRRLAAGMLGETAVPARLRGVPSVPSHPGAPLALRVLVHVAEMCCLSETFTGVYLTEMLARASHPAARAAVESLLEDEIDHGRVGWAYLASRRAEGRLDGLAEALPDMLDRTMRRAMSSAAADPEPDDPALEALGYLGNDTGAAIFTRTLRDVILPGFELLGLDRGPVERRAHERGWLA